MAGAQIKLVFPGMGWDCATSTNPGGGPRVTCTRNSSLPPARAVLATYRNAITRGASPREVSSVAEHIAFLIALWSPDDKPKQRILQQIQENLS